MDTLLVEKTWLRQVVQNLSAEARGLRDRLKAVEGLLERHLKRLRQIEIEMAQESGKVTVVTPADYRVTKAARMLEDLFGLMTEEERNEFLQRAREGL